MWKAPQRPNNRVTQSYNDGIVAIYSVVNTAQPGYQPEEMLIEKCVLRYEERQFGVQRYYSAKQNQAEIERVIRTPRMQSVSNQDMAITEDGTLYGIGMVQAVMDVYPPSMDITLTKIDRDYEVIE